MRYLLIIVLCLTVFSCQNNPNASSSVNNEDCDTAVVEEPTNYEVRDSGVPNNSPNLNTVQAATASQTPQWEDYGAVELWINSKGKEFDDQLHSYDTYELTKAGEGSVYVKHTQNGDVYELRFSNDRGNFSYHVAVGNFTVESDNGVMQFTAHAGPYYFDL